MAKWSSEAAARLGDAVKLRRAQLGLTQIDVWHANGPANSTLTAIESGTTTTISPATLRRLDTALKWPKGTAVAILSGHEPPQPRRRLEDVPTRELLEELGFRAGDDPPRYAPRADRSGL